MALTENYSRDHRLEAPVERKVEELNIGRFASRFVGVVFMAVAVGLWVAPGANWAADLALLKLGLTCFFTIVGALSLTIRRH